MYIHALSTGALRALRGATGSTGTPPYSGQPFSISCPPAYTAARPPTCPPACPAACPPVVLWMSKLNDQQGCLWMLHCGTGKFPHLLLLLVPEACSHSMDVHGACLPARLPDRLPARLPARLIDRPNNQPASAAALLPPADDLDQREGRLLFDR